MALSSDSGTVEVVACRITSPDRGVSLGVHAFFRAFSCSSFVAPKGRRVSGRLNVRNGAGRALYSVSRLGFSCGARRFFVGLGASVSTTM